MAARRAIAILSAAVIAVPTALAVSAAAETGGPFIAAREHPTGVVLSCSSQQGLGAGSRQFASRASLVVGPLAIPRAGGATGYSRDVGGDKFQVLVRGGHRVTVELSAGTRLGAGLAYGPPPAGGNWSLRDAHRVVTFTACRRGEIAGRFDGWPVSFWMGYVLARSPRCIPLRVWVDDEPSPRRAVIRLGVRSCE